MILEAERLKVWFPVKQGFCGARSPISRPWTAFPSSCAADRRWASPANPAPVRRRSASRCCASSPAKGRSPMWASASTGSRPGCGPAARDADRVPGPLWLASPAALGRANRRGGPGHPAARPVPRGAARTRLRRPDRGGARSRLRRTAIRTNSPAASASASPSRGP